MPHVIAERFYRTADLPPPREVVVRVIWDGRAPFLAARVRDPRLRGRDRDAWLTSDGVLLPNAARPRDPSRPWAGWHTLKSWEPELWAPQWPERWTLALPEPVEVDLDPPTRLWSARQRFQAVEDAEAADLAREMEADRESARVAAGSGGGSGRLAEGESEPPDKQWWLDPLAVTYSAPGAIGRREAEGRLMRALIAEQEIRVDRPIYKSFSTLLGSMVKPEPLAPGELAALEPARIRPALTGRDQDDCSIALAWLRALGSGAPETVLGGERVLRLRASVPALAWSRIAKGARLAGREAARRLYARALDEIVLEANGVTTAGGLAARERLREVRRAWLSRERGTVDT